MAKILIVDDAAFMRMMLKDILTKGGFEIAGEAADGVEAVAKYNELKPDLVTLDITMPNKDGIQALKEMAIHMGLSAEDVDQMLNLESGASSTGSLDDAYRVLGISPDASNDEVKAAYRKMALKHHPDKVAALGEDVRRAAEKKFQEINDAKDRIYKARGL